jgi:hypothetical protein
MQRSQGYEASTDYSSTEPGYSKPMERQWDQSIPILNDADNPAKAVQEILGSRAARGSDFCLRGYK